MKKKTCLKTKGFSVIELLVAVAILGVLSSLAIVNYNEYAHKTRITVVKTMIDDIEKALEICYIESTVPFSQHKPEDCLDNLTNIDVNGETKEESIVNKQITVKPGMIVRASKDSNDQKGCWSLKLEKSIDGRGEKHCIDFVIDQQKTSYRTDDGQQVICQSGVCQ